MKIGEASAASGCHIETIRYYERSGLLPSPARTAAGYRAYSAEQVQRIRFITRGRELGFSLQEIRSLLTLAEDARLSCDEVDRVARVHLAQVESRRRQLARLARELKRVIGNCVRNQRADCAILASLQPGTARSTPAPRVGLSVRASRRGAA